MGNNTHNEPERGTARPGHVGAKVPLFITVEAIKDHKYLTFLKEQVEPLYKRVRKARGAKTNPLSTQEWELIKGGTVLFPVIKEREFLAYLEQGVEKEFTRRGDYNKLAKRFPELREQYAGAVKTPKPEEPAAKIVKQPKSRGSETAIAKMSLHEYLLYLCRETGRYVTLEYSGGSPTRTVGFEKKQNSKPMSLADLSMEIYENVSNITSQIKEGRFTAAFAKMTLEFMKLGKKEQETFVQKFKEYCHEYERADANELKRDLKIGQETDRERKRIRGNDRK